MKTNNVLRTVVSAATSLGINAIPVGVVLAWGKSLETGMVLYFLETLLGILLTVALILLRAPAEDPGYAAIASSTTTTTTNGHVVRRYQAGNRRSLLEGYLIFSVGFAVVPSIFLMFWIFVVAQKGLSAAAVASGLSGIVAFQAIDFIAELFRFGSLTPAGANTLINQSMGRVALIYLSVFAGMIIALVFAVRWFIIPFGILKTLSDLGFLFRKNRAIDLQAVDEAASPG